MLSESDGYFEIKKPPQRGPLKVQGRRQKELCIIFNLGQRGMQVPARRKPKYQRP